MASPARESTVTSLTQRLIDDIETQIRSGALPPGAKLPSGRQLRAQHGVSQMTVRIAVERLRASGWVVTVPGAGVFVAEHPPIG